VETNPLVDPGYTTALNVNRCIREMLVGLALRKQGIRSADYLDPRMTGEA
jgi:agmatinase